SAELRFRLPAPQGLAAPRLSVRGRLLPDQPLLQGRRAHPPALQAIRAGRLVPVRVQAVRVPPVPAPGHPDGGLPAARRLLPAIAVVVNLALNFALIPLYGYLAASATTVVTEAAFSVAGWWLVGRRYQLPWLRLSWRVVLAGLAMGAVLVPLAGRSIFISVPV